MVRQQDSEQSGLIFGDPRATVFQSDPLLVSQYVNARRAQDNLVPEKRLMLAILEDAIFCFQEHHAARHGKRKLEFNKVRRWLFEPAEDWVFSFENICSGLALDSRYVRSGLLLWLKRNRSALRSAPVRRPDRKRPAFRGAMARTA